MLLRITWAGRKFGLFSDENGIGLIPRNGTFGAQRSSPFQEAERGTMWEREADVNGIHPHERGSKIALLALFWCAAFPSNKYLFMYSKEFVFG